MRGGQVGWSRWVAPWVACTGAARTGGWPTRRREIAPAEAGRYPTRANCCNAASLSPLVRQTGGQEHAYAVIGCMRDARYVGVIAPRLTHAVWRLSVCCGTWISTPSRPARAVWS